MKLLFDSHALVWFLLGSSRCPQKVRDMAAEAEIVISAVVVWEVSTKVNRGRWPEAAVVAETLGDLLAGNRYTPLPITIRHARVASLLPGRHRDPFDRMLAAQAQVEDIPLATADRAFQEFGTMTVWD